MTTKTKALIGLAYVILALVAIGGYGYPKFAAVVQGVSPAGSTGSTQKLYTIDVAPATATSTFLFNTDGTDRAVTDVLAYCTSVGTSKTGFTGTGLANWNVTAATTSVNTVPVLSAVNTNYLTNTNISTSSAWSYFSSSTMATANDMTRVWPTGTYLMFSFNATNTAACTIGVRTVSL